MKRSLVTLLLVVAVLVTTSGCVTRATRARSSAATFAAERGASDTLVSSLQRGTRLSVVDIEELAVLKVPDDVTLGYLRETRATYQLTSGQVARLGEGGVSDRVIDYMLTTPDRVAVRYPGTYGGGMRVRGLGNGGRGYGGRGFGIRGHGSHRGGRH